MEDVTHVADIDELLDDNRRTIEQLQHQLDVMAVGIHELTAENAELRKLVKDMLINFAASLKME